MFGMIALSLILIIITLCYFYVKRKYNYWSSRGVKVPPYLPILGHAYPLFFRGHRWKYIDEMYKKYEDERFWGMYEGFNPTFHIKDPDLIKDILVKHADHFVDRRVLDFSGEDKIFNEFLSNLKGESWKSLRNIMSPTFSSGKIKGMFPLIYSCSNNLITKCNEEGENESNVNMNALFGDYTMDVIASCAFGIEANCLLGENSEFARVAKSVTDINLSFIGILKFSLLFFSPRLFYALGLSLTKGREHILEMVKAPIKVRKESGIRRGDFLDLMMDALDENKKLEQKNKYPMTEDTIIAQTFLFLIGGFDTTANSLAFTAQLLAKNPECQTTLRNELKKIVENGGELTYHSIMEAPYLDACFSESLRMFSPLHFHERMCTREFRVSGTEIDLEYSTMVSIPVWSLHYDPSFWEEPNKYNPERFLPANKQDLVTYAYLPFGIGPRNCLGMRFALLAIKLALAKICLNFELSLEAGFEEINLSYSPSVLRPDKDGICVTLKKIEN